MTWFDAVAERIDYPRAVVTPSCFVEDNTTVNLDGLPEPNLVLRVRFLERRQSGLNHLFQERSRCDVVALVDTEPAPTIALIEAKSGNDSNNRDSANAVEQLQSSIAIMRDAVDSCSLDLPFTGLNECEMKAACVMESMRGNRLANETQRRFTGQFYRDNRVPLQFLPAGQDIWQAIQDGDPNHQ